MSDPKDDEVEAFLEATRGEWEEKQGWGDAWGRAWDKADKAHGIRGTMRVESAWREFYRCKGWPRPL